MEAKDAVVAGVGTNWAHKEMQNKKVAPSEGATNFDLCIFGGSGGVRTHDQGIMSPLL